jgi:hypothetical protein
MEEREKQELEAIESLCEHPGWDVLMRETQERIDQFRAGAPFNIADEKALFFAKGAIATLTELLGTAARCEQTRANQEPPADQLELYE